MPEPVLSVGALRERESRTWAAGIAVDDVIRKAGTAVGQAAQKRTRPGDPVLVLTGKGHNGDDAAVAARYLDDRDVTLLAFRETTPFDTALRWLETQRENPRALVVDGLFGIGLSRPLSGEWANLVLALNASRLDVLAVDVPSGLDADTGVAAGPTVEAAITLTLGSVKRGLLQESAARFVGRLELAPDIGLLPAVPETEVWWTLPRDFAGFPPPRPASGHKGTFGHLAILAGTLGYHGAAVLAAKGALRARPGLVTVLTDTACYVPVAAQLSSAMVRPWDGSRLAIDGFSALVIGPGLAAPSQTSAWRAEVQRLWREAPQPIVVDASALDWLETIPPGGPRVVTPHPGEAARSLGTAAATIQQDRIAALRRLAARWNSDRTTVVLKGRHTLIGGERGPVHVNSSGNPGLAQGGSGDVLAGYLGGLLAQPGLGTDLRHAVRFGVWHHGHAADRLEDQRTAWTIDDLIDALKEPR